MNEESEIDRLLQGAFDSRPRGEGGSPSMVDVRHRARRHQRRRVGSVVGATAVLGVSGVAVLASRGDTESGLAGDEPTSTWSMTAAGPVCGYTRTDAFPTSSTDYFGNVITTLVGSTLPAEATTTTLSDSSGCIPSGKFRCLGNNGMDDQGYTYFEYCEPIYQMLPPETTTTYPSVTMPDYTTYEVLDTTTTSPPITTTTESPLAPTTTTSTTVIPTTTT